MSVPAAEGVGRRRGARVSRVVVVAALTACVTTTSRFFLPSPQNPTYRPATAESVLTDYVRLQCEPRRAAQRPDTGSAALVIEIDSTGRATRAQLLRSSRDSLLDGIFGTVAAQLRLDRDSAAITPIGRSSSEPVRIDFRCAGDSASVRLVIGGR